MTYLAMFDFEVKASNIIQMIFNLYWKSPRRWSAELKEGYDLVAISDKSPLYDPPNSCGCGLDDYYPC